MSSLETPGKRELKKADKRRRIIDAAKHLFETKGFENTTTAEISELAGIGTGTLYLYVTSKEQLLVEVFWEDLGHVWIDALDTIDRSQSALDQLLGLFETISAYHSAEPGLSRVYFKELMFLPPESADEIREIMRKIFARIDGLLTDAQMAGRLDSGVGVEQLTRNLFNLWHHLMLRRYSGQTTDAQTTEYLKRSFSVALTGLTPG